MPTLEDYIADDFRLLLETTAYSAPKLITFYKRKSRVLDTITSKLVDTNIAYPLMAIITKYVPTETTSLKTLMEVGPVTFHVRVSRISVYSSPEEGLNIEPSVADFVIYNDHKFEVFSWELSAVRSEYRLHCKRTDFQRQ